jgi:uncharacterized integral membrane protein
MAAPSGQIPEELPPEQEERQRRSRKETTRTVALIVIAILATLFAAKNGKEVRVDWIVGSGKAPLIIVIVVSLLAGIIAANLGGRIARRRKR